MHPQIFLISVSQQNVVKCFRRKQELRHFLHQHHCDAGGLTRQTLLNRTRWAAPSDAPSLGLRRAMELRALLLLLLCFPGFQAQILRTEETRSEGSSLYIQCPYTAQTTHQQQKAWCRLRNRQCEPLVVTKEYSHTNWATKGRVALKDNPTERTVSVTMTELQAEDSGRYFCAYYSYGYHQLRMISLFVFKELHKWELDSVSVQCLPSTLNYSLGTKVWCRREDETLCSFIVRTDYSSTQHNSKALEDRTLIQDDTQKRTVTITMQKLQAEDSGMYWCALYRRSSLTWLMEVRLSVFKRTKQYTAKESGDVSVQCPYSVPEYRAVSKAWCKEGARKSCTVLVTTNSLEYQRTPQQGRVRIQDDTEQGIVTVTMERLQAQDTGVYWCALYEHAHLFRMLEVTLNVSEVLAGTTLPGAAGTSQATPAANSPAPSLIMGCNSITLCYCLTLVTPLLSWLQLKWKHHPAVWDPEHPVLPGTHQLGNTVCQALQAAERNRYVESEDTYEKPGNTAQPDSYERLPSPRDNSKDLKYVTLNFKSRLSPEDPLYCNVELSEVLRKPKDENVEYATIAVKQLTTNDKG
ncbi:polymeric immunoglobulin receptor-like isoform X1 [Pezoporus flaviventris]|uniref:polymeric immunoglobulin receptor-like isoform X1 n=1 Tax=Pezoporus flaviventris TaxID=889875 RepID=UPI002AB2C7DA|nr:polymeric immunoglobulin receptor-like isoform X1 [Pezoporus flaviventris]